MKNTNQPDPIFEEKLEYAEKVDPDDLDHQLISNPAEIAPLLQSELDEARKKHVEINADNPTWDNVKNIHISDKEPPCPPKKHQEDLRLQEAVGFFCMKGKRESMEDAHLATVLDIPFKDRHFQVPIFAIFDGHGGSRCAKFMQEHLASHLYQNLPIALKAYPEVDSAIFNCLIFTCNQLNDEFLKDTSGTTANVVMIFSGALWVANLGDTRAILCQSNKMPVALSQDARIDTQNVEESIKQRGGSIIAGRVEGQIQVASAIGDIGILGISHRPKVSKFPIPDPLPTDLKLVIACDGLWDVASTLQVARDVAKLNDKSPKQIASYLVHKAYKAGSQDNISVYVVDLPKLLETPSKRKRKNH